MYMKEMYFSLINLFHDSAAFLKPLKTSDKNKEEVNGLRKKILLKNRRGVSHQNNKVRHNDTALSMSMSKLYQSTFYNVNINYFKSALTGL